MTTAKERVPLLAVEDRIPHPKIAYAYLNIQVTGTVEEFLAYRTELLRKHPLYAESALAKQPDGPTPEAPGTVSDHEADALAQAEAFQADVEAAVDEPTSEAEPAASAPTAAAVAKAKLAGSKTKDDLLSKGTSTEGQSARDIARAKILAKKGA